MKNRLLSLSILALVACSSPKKDAMKDMAIVPHGPSKAHLAPITKKDLVRNLTFLASDEMKGRNTASPELKIAAKFIATQLESYGFKGIGPDGSFFQKVPLFEPSFKNETVALNYGGKALNAKYGEDVAVFAWGNDDLNISGDVEFVQNGLPDQIKDIDLKGKVAVRFGLNDEQRSKTRLTHQVIRDMLFAQGAKVVMYVVEDEDKKDVLFPRYDRLGSKGQLTNHRESNARAYVLVTRSVFDQMMKADKKRSIKSPFTFKKDMTVSVEANDDEIYSQNIVAVLEGTDPVLKNEYVGFGSHYDHDGVKGGQIYNGANDDGSGTTGLISVAKAMGENPPKRSILVVFHTAEEKGLLGSEYFTDNPLIDLKQLVSMTNMDMIGSNFQPERVYVVGSDRISQELHDINESVNVALDSMVLDYEWNAPLHEERIYYRSDHYNYAKHGVPIIFYSDKDPDNYHKPSDTVEKINFDKLFKITRLAFTTGYTVANQPHRLVLSNPVVKPIVEASVAQNYAGEYEVPGRFKFEIAYEDKMLFLIMANRRMLIEPIEGNKYHAMGVPLEFKFKDGEAKATRAILTWGRFGQFDGQRVK